MKRGLSIALVIVMTFALYGCNEPDVVIDMARFDRAYVPALVLTSKKDSTGKSVMAVKQLKMEWSVLVGRYQDLLSQGDEFEMIDAMVLEADSLVTIGQTTKAHKVLQGINDLLFELRQRHNIKYFPDRLEEFKAPMETLTKAIEGKTPRTLRASEVQRLMALTPVLQSLWDNVKKAKFNRDAFWFSKSKAKTLKELIEKQDELVQRLAEATKQGDKRDILKYGMEIKPGFLKVYKLFGNFEGASLH